MIWLWTGLSLKRMKERLYWLAAFTHLSDFCFSVGQNWMRWICSDGRSPSGPLWARGRNRAVPPDGFPGELGVICRARPRSALSHPSGGASASLTSSTPIQARAYGNQEFSPVLFEPRGNNSYLSLWKVVDFPILGSWVLIKKQQGKETPHIWQCEIKPPHCTFFFKNLRRLAFYFCQGKV